MLKRILLPLLLLFTVLPLSAQEEPRPDHEQRARPTRDPDFDMEKEEGEERPYLMRAPISNESGFFLNSNMIQEGSAINPQNESSIAINPLDPKMLISSAVDARSGAYDLDRWGAELGQ